jgi:hypothetical protein
VVVTILPAGTPPRIVTQPSSITIGEGNPVRLTLVTEGDDLDFQWLKDGVALPGETNSFLAISAATESDEGSYVLRISNEFGSVTTEPAIVTVVPPPQIVTQPEGRILAVGAAFELSVVATGEQTLQYQWLKDGVEVSGATLPTYQLAFAQASHAGTYRARVSHAYGSVLSREAVVVIAIPPVVTRQPASLTVNEGAELRLSFEASGTRPFSVEWLRDGTAVAVTPETELLIPQVQSRDAGSYVARITGPGGTTTSAAALVSILFKPVIETHPQSIVVDVGATVLLTVVASGNGTLTFQWFKDGQPIPGAENIFHRILSMTEADFGSYSVRVANTAGFVESNLARIERLRPDQLVDVLTISASAQGGGDTLSIVASGRPGATYDVQLSSDLRSNNWVTIQTVVADANGRFEIRPPGTQSGFWFIRTARR